MASVALLTSAGSYKNASTCNPSRHTSSALADHEAAARQALDDNAWAYFAGGAADELTLQANVQAWQRTQLLPRVLTALQGGHTQVQLLGRTLAHPVLLAPVAYQRMAHPDGELATALAAAAQGAGPGAEHPGQHPA
jgi:4-hydroxymandelate oxidase